MIDTEIILMLAFVVSALLLTMLFIGGFADDVPTVAAGGATEQPSLQGSSGGDRPSPPRESVFDEFRRGVAAVLDSSSVAPASSVAERPAAGLALLAPVEGETVYGDSFTVRFVAGGVRLGGAEESAGGDGAPMLPAALVRLTLDEGEPILLERAQPYTFEGVAEGEHLLTVELLSERLAPLRPEVTEWVRFTSENAPPPVFLPETGE